MCPIMDFRVDSLTSEESSQSLGLPLQAIEPFKDVLVWGLGLTTAIQEGGLLLTGFVGGQGSLGEGIK
jgi:hypothetical protein